MSIFIFRVHGYFSSHLIFGQGKANPENVKIDENVKFRLLHSQSSNLRGKDGIFKKMDVYRYLPQTQALPFQNTLLLILAPCTAAIPGAKRREGCSFFTKDLEW